MKTNEINIRDPFVLVHEGCYYLYGTRGENAFSGEATGFDVYTGTDLEEWEGPFEVFHRPEGFFSRKSYWAPEVYAYGGRFYMFATFENEQKGLGTAVLAADSPVGPFDLWSAGYVTPGDWRCLDGTLYLAPNATPYMVFCHEWKQVHNGTVCAVQLTPDLKQAVGEPRELFAASSAKPFVKKFMFRNYVTDGPYLLRTEDGRLHMLWSTYGKTGYVQAMAHSDNDDLTGQWTVDEKLLYDHDGGHGMIFQDLQGQYRMTLHNPNTPKKERPIFLPLSYSGEFTLRG